MQEYTIAFRLTKAHANADAMSRLPLTVQPATVPQPPEIILMMEQLDKSLVTATTGLTLTLCYHEYTSVVQNGWPRSMKDELLKPYFSRQTELSVQDGCLYPLEKQSSYSQSRII